jgi:hypothetical protein
MMPLTSSEIQHLASESAKAAVREMLLALGVNANDPEAILKMQQDFAYLRDVREAVGTIKARGLMVAVGIIVSGVMGAIWMAVRGHTP